MDDGLDLTQGRTQVMTRETKIGLLLGMGVILLIGIIISDQLSQVNQNDPADFTEFAGDTQRSIEASDATPAPGYDPGYDPGYAPGRTPAGVPADNSTVTDIPNDFLIPYDVQKTLPQRQADSTSVEQPKTIQQPLTAFNVDPSTNRQTDLAEDDVPTITIGDTESEPPHYAQSSVPALPERTATPRISPAANGTAVIRHTVLPGESLIKIARRHYGNGDYWKAIALANPGKVSRDGLVNSGVVLDIPKRDDAVLGLDIESSGQEITRPIDIRTAVASTRTIDVKSGDTLSELASKHMGSAALWEDLLEANKDQLKDEHSLQVGMKLRVPGTTSQAQAPVAVDKPTTTRSSSGKTYTVKPGDNLTEIAEKMLGDGNRWREIFEANRDKMQSADRVKVGQKLRIPA